MRIDDLNEYFEIPEVTKSDANGYSYYKAGDWSFDLAEDALEDARSAIGSWIAWYEFLKARKV